LTVDFSQPQPFTGFFTKVGSFRNDPTFSYFGPVMSESEKTERTVPPLESRAVQAQSDILASAEAFVAGLYERRMSKDFVYHDFQHTASVVLAAQKLGELSELDERQMEIVQLATWFHDTGYDKGAEGHEERSCEYVRNFLKEKNYPPEDIRIVQGCIMATKLPQNPQSLLEEIVCDSDLSHLGNEMYWDRCGRLRQELLITRNVVMSEQEWVDFELDFITNHEYHTEIAQNLYNKQKKRHIKQLRKQKLRLHPRLAEIVEEAVVEKERKKKKRRKKEPFEDPRLELKELNLGRGVETMYRTTYRTHVNLSSIADNKANIMLSINAIIISIVVANLPQQFDSNPALIIPTSILLLACLSALVFAILATRPKITEGKFTREDIEQKRANLLFFGNFYNMDLEDFHMGMMDMIKDSDFLYSSMTRDLYYLGVVLAKKYRYLRICYSVFMYGLIAAVIAFGIAFL
jgi:predicted metal-dependent HD superfamily phosphohydrolase